MVKYTKEIFEQLGTSRHGENAFAYSEVDYVNSQTLVKLICNTCGNPCWPRPSDHLRGRGCPVCSRVGLNLKWTLEAFVEAANKKHGHKYQYDEIDNFRGLFHKVYITCPKHGPFEQLPDAHLRGRGCPHCWEERRKKTVCGIGINDFEGNIRPNGILLPSYKSWRNMMVRCYNKTELAKRPTYVGCSVCDEWLSFKAFKMWFDDPANGYMEGYHLDKDILVLGNQVYSPDTCCFVPNEINALIKKSTKNNGLPMGVYRIKSGRFCAMYGGDKGSYIGAFDTIEEAYNAYCDAKEKAIKKIADEYYSKGLITQKVYDALQKYKVKL